MSKYPEALLQVQPASDLEFFFMFALKVLNGTSFLSKGSACEFWVSSWRGLPLAFEDDPTDPEQSAFVSIKPENPETKAGFNNAIEHLGPLLARALVFNVSGMASRSELDKLSDVLKKLVTQHPRTKEWLEVALTDPAIPNTMASQEDKDMFLKKIMR